MLTRNRLAHMICYFFSTPRKCGLFRVVVGGYLRAKRENSLRELMLGTIYHKRTIAHYRCIFVALCVSEMWVRRDFEKLKHFLLPMIHTRTPEFLQICIVLSRVWPVWPAVNTPNTHNADSTGSGQRVGAIWTDACGPPFQRLI